MDTKEIMQILMLKNMQLLSGFLQLPEFDIRTPEGAEAWRTTANKRTAARITWECTECSNPHLGLLTVVAEYDKLPKKFELAGLDLTGWCIVTGYKNIGEMLMPIPAPQVLLLNREGKLKKISMRLQALVVDYIPLTEEDKVNAMLVGFTPQDWGRESWDD